MRARLARLGAVLLTGAVTITACASNPLAMPDGPATATVALPASTTPGSASDGAVRVAYPSEPARFLAPASQDVAAQDLAALWGLPLFRLDEAGQQRRGLVEDWTVAGVREAGWVVRLELRPGRWSDGSDVDAEDVVATIRARVAADGARFGVIAGVRAVDADTVAVAFARPYASWADLLVEVGTMLPSELAGTPDRYASGVPVSGGWFRVAAYEPGLRVVFEAHADGPLGAPRLQRVVVLFAPSYENALGLLADDRVDALVGYLPLNGVARAAELTGVQAASPLGGTQVSLEFRASGALGGADLAGRRRGVVETVDVSELIEGLLGPNGRRATSVWPTVDLESAPPVGEVRDGLDLAIVFPSGSEVLGFTMRAIQRDLVARGIEVELVGEQAPRYARVVGSEHDAALTVRRTPRRPALGAWIADTAVARGAGAAAVDAAEARAGLTAVASEGRIAPLYRVGVLHAWRDVTGLRPSAWVGTGFWNVGEWHRTDG